MAKGFDGLKDWNIKPTSVTIKENKTEQTTVNKQPIQEKYDEKSHTQQALYIFLILIFFILVNIILNSR